MVLNQCKIQLSVGTENLAANPGTINSWMKLNNGFEDGYGFKWTAVDSLGMVYEKFSQNATELTQQFDLGKVIILHVRNNNHYVLMTGYGYNGGDLAFYVNDPFYDTNYYPQAEVVKGEAAIFYLDSVKCSNQRALLSQAFLY
jgi:hypothetical protein